MAVEVVGEGCFAGGWRGGYLDDADGVEEVCEFGDGGEAVDCVGCFSKQRIVGFAILLVGGEGVKAGIAGMGNSGIAGDA